ncbi:MAG: SpoIID/LytB domain-containing protein [Solirubrobacteraceae bacterium]
MRLAAALAVGLSALASAGQASAAGTFYVKGGGYGHGVGLSQYGAYGYALHGKGYRFILAHYYQGTSIGTTNPDQIVKVLLSTGQASFAGATRVGAKQLQPGTTYIVKPLADGRLKLVTSAGKKVKATFSSPLTVTGPTPLLLAGHGSYQGSLQFSTDGSGGVQTVNAVPLDDYVEGVVPAEMPSSWAPQALEAQAVAARTYAITTSVQGSGFSLYDDTRSQMYGGVGVETAATNAAVQATSGEVVTYTDHPVVTYFFSSSGGYTESVQNVWSGASPEPWLTGVPDPYDGVAGNPYHHWSYKMSVAAATRRLGSLVKGQLLGISVTKHGVSPRIIEAQVVGTRGRTGVSGPTLQQIFGLPTTYASFTVISSSSAHGQVRGNVSSTGGSGAVALQYWARGVWKTVARDGVSRLGRYRVMVPRSGRYRIAFARLHGPALIAFKPKPPRRPPALLNAMGGPLSAAVSVYSAANARPAARDRRPVRSVPLVLRAAGVHHRR